MNNFEDNRYFRDDEDGGTALKKRLFRREKANKKRNYGLILSFLFAISDNILRLCKDSMIGHFFSSLYLKWNEKWRNGALSKLFKGKRAAGEVRRPYLRAKVAKLYENSLINRLISQISDLIIHSHTRIWGFMLFSFAFVSVFVTMVKYYLISELSFENIVIGIVIALVSLPLSVSKKRLGESILNGKISGFIMKNILMVDESKFERDDSKTGGNYSFALFVSAAAGLATYFISPFDIITAVVLAVLFVLVMCFPELGIMSVLALIPFSTVFARPSVVMFIIVLFSIISFLSKYIRGKRTLKFEIIDIFVAFFGIMILLGGVFTTGGISSFFSAGMYFVFLTIYFLVVNSYIRKTWIYRGIKLIVISTSIVAILGIFEDGVVSSSWVDMSVFSDIGGRISSFLGNPNMLGVYLVIVFPLIMAQAVSAERKFHKMCYAICALAVFACTVMTWSRGAWLGIIFATLLFLVMYNFKNIWIIVAGIVSFPIWVMLLPESIIRRFLSILTMSDSSVIYRFNTWRGVLSMIWDHLFTGIGVGESAFKNVYALYAVSGTETVMHSHNIFLQIALEIGIVGLLIFMFIMLMFIQKTLGGIGIRKHDSKSRIMILAGFSGIMGSLVMGLFDYIWYNYRVFLIFWAVISLCIAMIRINDNEKAKADAAMMNGDMQVDIDIY